jgi:hypothetical protein
VTHHRRPNLGAFAHRALKPPTSSSLADERPVCSLLLSTAARDPRRSRPALGAGQPDMVRHLWARIRLADRILAHRLSPLSPP